MDVQSYLATLSSHQVAPDLAINGGPLGKIYQQLFDSLVAMLADSAQHSDVYLGETPDAELAFAAGLRALEEARYSMFNADKAEDSRSDHRRMLAAGLACLQALELSKSDYFDQFHQRGKFLQKST